MAGSIREIKRRIKSVGSTRQITNAMNLVASSKFNRSKDRFGQIRPFYEMTMDVISDIAESLDSVAGRYFAAREVKHTTIIVLAGDRGLCGGYNIEVCKHAMGMEPEGSTCEYITVGSKAYEYLMGKKRAVSKGYRGISENPSYEDARCIGEEVVKAYKEGKTDEVYLVYTKFISTLTGESTAVKLFPFDISDLRTEGREKTLTIYEPSAEAVFAYVLPKYINTVIYGAMAEAALCEQSARMTAMDSATENADEMLDSLNTRYNRARQSAITQEITEIVAGSEL